MVQLWKERSLFSISEGLSYMSVSLLRKICFPYGPLPRPLLKKDKQTKTNRQQNVLLLLFNLSVFR